MAERKKKTESMLKARQSQAKASLPPLPNPDVAGLAAPLMLTPSALSVHGSLAPPLNLAPVLSPLEEFFHDPERDGLVVETEVSQQTGSDRLDERARTLLFRVGDEDYGVSIMDIREILKPPMLTEVPRAPLHILGVFSLRGTVFPVVTLTTLLGVKSNAKYQSTDSRVLVVGRGEESVGLHVDTVDQVVKMDLRSLEPTPGGISREKRALVQGLGRVAERLIIVLDLPNVLAGLGMNAHSDREEVA